MRRALPALLLLLAAALPVAAQSNPGHYQGFGDARGFLNIVPPGQDGVLNGPEAIQAQGESSWEGTEGGRHDHDALAAD